MLRLVGKSNSLFVRLRAFASLAGALLAVVLILGLTLRWVAHVEGQKPPQAAQTEVEVPLPLEKKMVTFKVRTGALPWGLEYREFQHDDGCWYMLVCRRQPSGLNPDDVLAVVHKATCRNEAHFRAPMLPPTNPRVQ